MSDEEFRAYYAAAYPRLVGQVYLLTGDRAEAQDVVQEAFVGLDPAAAVRRR